MSLIWGFKWNNYILSKALTMNLIFVVVKFQSKPKKWCFIGVPSLTWNDISLPENFRISQHFHDLCFRCWVFWFELESVFSLLRPRAIIGNIQGWRTKNETSTSFSIFVVLYNESLISWKYIIIVKGVQYKA